MILLKKQLGEAVRMLNAMRIDYAVVGGLAVNLYGEPRFTADVDINILLEDEKVNMFIAKAKQYGFRPACADIKVFTRKTGVIPMVLSRRGLNGRCDFIIAENALEKSALIRARTRKIGSVTAKFISPEDLVIHKIVSTRPHDREDVPGILSRLQGRLDMKYIKKWLHKLDKIDKNLKSLVLFSKLLKDA